MKNLKTKNLISLFLAIVMLISALPMSAQAASVSAPKIKSVSASRNVLTVNWSQVSSADGYQLQYSTNSDFSGKKSLTFTKSQQSTSIKKLKYSKKYYIRVRARKGSSYSSWVKTSKSTRSSNEAHSTAIKTLSPKEKGFSLVLKEITGATGYQIQYSKDKNFKNGVKSVNTKSYKKTISDLTYKKTYYVRARTYKVKNGKKYYSAWTSKKSVYTSLCPKNLTSFSATAAAGAINAKASYGKANGWQICVSKNSSFKSGNSYKYVSGKSSYIYGGLGVNSTTYYVRARAYNKVGTKYYYSSWSKAIKVTTTKVQKPESLSKDRVSVKSKSFDYITLSINQAANNANKYKVIYSNKSDFTNSKEKIFSTTTCKITGLKEKTTYYFKIYSVNQINGNTATSSSFVSISDTTLPDTRPVITTTSASNTSFVVTWNEVPGATSYTVVYGQKDSTHFYGFEKQEEVTTTSFEATDLYDGESYYFKVKANGIENALYRETTVDTKRKAINSGVTETKTIYDGIPWECILNKPAICSPYIYKMYNKPSPDDRFEEYYRALNRIYRETGCTDDMDDITKYILITEWIYCNVAYTDNVPVDNTSYEAVFKGKTTCMGYASLFVDLCYLANIPAYYVRSTVTDSFNHAYAVFKLNGYWYIGNSQNGMGFTDLLNCGDPFDEFDFPYLIENNESGFGSLMYINGINKYWVHMAQPYKNMVTNQCKPYGTVNTHKATDQAFWDAAKYAYITQMVGRYKNNVNAAKNTGYNIVLKTEYKY